MDEAAQEKFETELFWCIQKLQNSLSSGKLNKKQTEDAAKVLKTLSSSKAPLVRKRQLMSTQFGNYRAKIEEEEKKAEKTMKNIKLVQISPSKKSVFIKPCATSKNNEQNSDNGIKENSEISFKFKPSDNGFRFNFETSTEN